MCPRTIGILRDAVNNFHNPFTVYINELDLHPGDFFEDSPISYVGSF